MHADLAAEGQTSWDIVGESCDMAKDCCTSAAICTYLQHSTEHLCLSSVLSLDSRYCSDVVCCTGGYTLSQD